MGRSAGLAGARARLSGPAVAPGKAGPALCELEAPDDPGAGVVLPRSLTDLEFVGARDLGLAPGVLIVKVRHVNVAVVARVGARRAGRRRSPSPIRVHTKVTIPPLTKACEEFPETLARRS